MGAVEADHPGRQSEGGGKNGGENGKKIVVKTVKIRMIMGHQASHGFWGRQIITLTGLIR